VLSVPETRLTRTPLSLVTSRANLDLPLRTVDLADEALRINPVLSQAMDRAQRLLSAGLPLVVTGESGSGKTAFAKAVARHCFGETSELVFVDCAALDHQADFGALLQRRLKGQQSCLLIDRIDEMDETRQTALLGLLESDRQAGANGIGVIVISTLVRENRLRSDLLHRLKGGAITLPPLRNVPDLEATIRDLFRIEREALGKVQLELDDEARLVLMHYHWPGNLRELRNALRHAIALADGKLIRLDHLPGDIVDEIARKDLTARSQSEASKIEAALRYNGGNVSLTARYLGVSRATLYRKIQIQKARSEA
jgi:sigma-54 dependent transcriptional regulator, acetoin dehydrogenase operon transcriptional activator AcoR